MSIEETSVDERVAFHNRHKFHLVVVPIDRKLPQGLVDFGRYVIVVNRKVMSLGLLLLLLGVALLMLLICLALLLIRLLLSLLLLSVEVVQILKTLELGRNLKVK